EHTGGGEQTSQRKPKTGVRESADPSRMEIEDAKQLSRATKTENHQNPPENA
ncbi:hypothetical protein A2U01_0078501, partial [Trifolium medium]|nr:hypothetical protein [Trifolium medium]